MCRSGAVGQCMCSGFDTVAPLGQGGENTSSLQGHPHWPSHIQVITSATSQVTNHQLHGNLGLVKCGVLHQNKKAQQENKFPRIYLRTAQTQKNPPTPDLGLKREWPKKKERCGWATNPPWPFFSLVPFLFLRSRSLKGLFALPPRSRSRLSSPAEGSVVIHPSTSSFDSSVIESSAYTGGQ